MNLGLYFADRVTLAVHDNEENKEFAAALRSLTSSVRVPPPTVAIESYREDGAPEWWDGDEEASQSSQLAAMMVRQGGN